MEADFGEHAPGTESHRETPGPVVLPGLAMALVLALWVLPAAAAQSREPGIRVDGSSTLYPGALAIAEELSPEEGAWDVQVGFSGTAGGLGSFCRGDAEIATASRSAFPEEVEACEANGVDFVVVPVAVDAVMVLVNSENGAVDCLSLAELRAMWQRDSRLEMWSDVREGWPREEISFYAPGVASGTHDYWREVVVGGDRLRTDFFPSEDDAALARRVSGDPWSITFIGRASARGAGEGASAVAVDDGEGCIDPAWVTDPFATRWPLVRPLYLYVNAEAAVSSPHLKRYVESFLWQRGQELLEELGYLGLGEEAALAALARFRDLTIGPLESDAQGTALLRRLPGSTR